MKVIAIRMGYYNHKRRREGDIFELKAGYKLGSWMEEYRPGEAKGAVMHEIDESPEVGSQSAAPKNRRPISAPGTSAAAKAEAAGEVI